MSEFRKREGKKGKRSDARRPQSCHEANACVGLFINFIHTQACACRFPTLLHPVFSSPPSFLFLGNLPPLVGGLDFIACWPCLAPSGFTTRGGNPLKGSYYDGRCYTAHVCRGDAHFPICVRIAAKISKRFSGNEGAECTRWTQEPRLIVVQVALWC